MTEPITPTGFQSRFIKTLLSDKSFPGHGQRMTIGAVGQRNIPALVASLQPKLHGQIAESGAAVAAVARFGSSHALSVKELLQRLEKFSVAPGVWNAHYCLFQIRLRRGLYT